MASKNFWSKLRSASEQNSSWLCLGLDPQFPRLPDQLKRFSDPEAALRFNQAIIQATAPYVCAYKPNLAYFEVLGGEGLDILKKTIQAVPPRIPVILDGKRADVGHSADFYARAAFDFLGADAATVNPYLGSDSIEPFLKYADKGVFVLCLTSNPGAAEFQKTGQPPLYAQVARSAAEKWNRNKNCGLVVGATASPADWQKIKEAAPDLPWLIPGLGAQGGKLDKLISVVRPDRSAAASSGKKLAARPALAQASAGASPRAKTSAEQSSVPLIFNVSRSILYASSGDDFEIAAAREAKVWRDRINQTFKKAN